jgi:hypothetical protein
MAAVRIPYQAQRNLLKAWIVETANLTFHLYDNDVTPTLNTVLSDFTEASYAGYAEQVVPPATEATDTVNQFSYSTPVGVAFPPATAGWPINLYGVFVTGAGDDSTALVAAWRFDGAPFVLSSMVDFVIFGFVMRDRETNTSFTSFIVVIDASSTSNVLLDGNTYPVTVTALDAFGNVVTSYNGPVSLGLYSTAGTPVGGLTVPWIADSGALYSPSVTLTSGVGSDSIYYHGASPSTNQLVYIAATDGVYNGSVSATAQF